MRRGCVVVLALVALACGSEKGSDTDKVVENANLTGMAGCEGLKKEIEARAIREMNAEIDAILDRIDGREGDFSIGGGSVPASAPTPTPSPAPREEAADFTTTNTQEKDVDEPDFVKNDASRIFALNGRRLVALAAWPPENARLEWETTLEGQPISLLLHRDRLVVFTSVWLPQLGTQQGSYPRYSSILPYAIGNAMKVTVLDVAGGEPKALDEQYIEGTFLAGRRTGDSVRAISTAGRRGPELLYWPEGEVRWSSRSAAIKAMEKVRQENVKRIKASPLEDWLPRAFSKDAAGGLVPVAQQCTSFSATNVPSRLGFTTVSTVDLNELKTRRNTIVSEASEVYSSTKSLYLTARHDWTSHPSQTEVREDHTYVFQFDIASDPRQSIYAASGGVPGHLVNQFSLDEEGGFLRVATTRETRLGWQLMSSANNVYVLQRSSDRLVRVGEITGLARNERLYAARFEGPRGYLVTFRNVDPLFTLDLSDPRRPRVAGELKVPGYSTYLHLMDTTHLLTIGREVSEDGRFLGGLALQIFDVSNFASPTLQHRLVLGSHSTYSEAEYDHKAFNYFASRGLLTIPFSDWSSARQQGFVSGLEVLQATTASGIVPLGSVDHGDLFHGRPGSYDSWTPSIRRSVMMEDYVWSVSAAGAKLNDTRNLSRTVQTIAFSESE